MTITFSADNGGLKLKYWFIAAAISVAAIWGDPLLNVIVTVIMTGSAVVGMLAVFAGQPITCSNWIELPYGRPKLEVQSDALDVQK